MLAHRARTFGGCLARCSRSMAAAAVTAAATAGMAAAVPAAAATAAGPFTVETGFGTTFAASPAPAATEEVPLEALRFDNRSLRELPLDPVAENFVRQVPHAIFSRVEPTPVEHPQVVAVSAPALALLNLGDAAVARDDFAEFFAGNKLLPGAQPAAHCYCGHQFGSFAGQLGDGATMYLGEIVTRHADVPATAGGGDGEGSADTAAPLARVELQFKGAGKTPYSRTADGRKVLRSSIREFLCSELMAALGVPTTRAATLVTSDTHVARDIFYTGDVIEERATVITRLAPTFIRFGSFEIFKSRDADTGRAGPSAGDKELLARLADFTCRHYFPHIAAAHAASAPHRIFAMYQEIVRRTAHLVAKWQAFGWCHGVLNTDNMSIVGVTIDYGPYGWLDRYDPEFVCNNSDDQGRYSYENQPHAVRWNCIKLGEALSPLWAGVADIDWKRSLPAAYDAEYRAHYNDLMRRKLGLGFAGAAAAAPASADADVDMVTQLLEIMNKTGADYTNTFRTLMAVRIPATAAAATDGGAATAAAGAGTSSAADPVLPLLLRDLAPASEIAEGSRPRIQPQQLQMFLALAQRDPRYASQLPMLEAEMERFLRFTNLSKRSDADKAADDRRLWATWLAQYRARLRAEAATAGADVPLAALETARLGLMAVVNPKYVLRNWIAHQAITKADAGDFSEVQRVLARMLDPFGRGDGDTAVTDPTASEEAAAVAMAAPTGAGAAAGGDTDMASAGIKAPSTAFADAPDGAGASGTGACSSSGTCSVVDGGGDYTSRPPGWAKGLKVTCSS